MKNRKWMAALLAAALAVTGITPFTIFESEVQAATLVEGDVDGSNAFDVLDMIRLKRHQLDSSIQINAENSDVNGDNQIDTDDTTTLLKALVGGEMSGFWGDRVGMQVDIGTISDKKESTKVNTDTGTGASYMYLNGKATDVYLSVKYTTSISKDACNHAGITIRQVTGETTETRQIGFQGSGISVMKDYSYTGGIVGSTNPMFGYNTAGRDEYVWAQRTGSGAEGCISYKLVSVAGTYQVDWAITGGILYARIEGQPVLCLPLKNICETWTAEQQYEIGLSMWDNGSNENGTVTFSNIEVYFGEEAVNEIVADKKVNFSVTEQMYYDAMSGTYIPRTANPATSSTPPVYAYAYGKANTGNQSMSTSVRLIDPDNTNSASGISLRVGEKSAEIITEPSKTWLQRNHADTEATEITLLNDATRFNDGICRMTAIIQEEEVTGTESVTTKDTLYLYYNGILAYKATLAELIEEYEEGSSVQLGIASWNAYKGLMKFEDIKFNTWEDSFRMNMTGGNDGVTITTNEVASGNYYVYLGEASTDIYLAADYTTTGVRYDDTTQRYRQWLFGITIEEVIETEDSTEEAGENTSGTLQSRQIELHTEAVAVRSNYEWDGDGIPGIQEDYDTWIANGKAEGTNPIYSYNAADKSNHVWGRHKGISALNTEDSIVEIITRSGDAGTYRLEWAITGGILYLTVEDEPILSMPLENLCAGWGAEYPEKQYRIGFSCWDTDKNCKQITVSNIDARYGDEAKAKMVPHDDVIEENNTYAEEGKHYYQGQMYYHALNGYLPNCTTSGARYAYGTGVAGTQGISTVVKLFAIDDIESAVGISLKSGEQSAQIVIQGDGSVDNGYRIQTNHAWSTPQATISKSEIGTALYAEDTIMTHGVGNITAFIKDGKVYVFFNGEQAGSVELYKILPGYKSEDKIQLGIYAWDANLGLASFNNTKFLTQDEVDAIDIGWNKWDIEFLNYTETGSTSVDRKLGTVKKTAANSSTVTGVQFLGESQTWEINGSMRREGELGLGNLPQGFEICVGEAKVSFWGHNRGFAVSGNTGINTRSWCFTYNNINNNYVCNDVSYGYFASPVTTRTEEWVSFKLIIAADTLYVWFDDVPSWIVPLDSEITGTYASTGESGVVHAGFAADSYYGVSVKTEKGDELGNFECLTVESGDAVDLSCLDAFNLSE